MGWTKSDLERLGVCLSVAMLPELPIYWKNQGGGGKNSSLGRGGPGRLVGTDQEEGVILRWPDGHEFRVVIF